MTVEERIAALATLFNQRSDIDRQIAALLEGHAEPEKEASAERKPRRVKRIGRKKLTDEQREAIKQDIVAGMKPGEACEKHGISLPTYSRIKASMPREPRGLFYYRCLNCGKDFKSNLPKLDAYCPQPTCNKAMDIEEVHA